MNTDETAKQIEEHASKFIQAMLMNGLNGFPANRAAGVEEAVDLARELVDQINKKFR